MFVSPLNNSKYNNPNFRHTSSGDLKKYSLKEKAIVATTTAVGIGTSLALLAKGRKYSLNPKKMTRNIRKSYMANAQFYAKEVCAMGVGTCLGGLAGGFIIDKDKRDRKAKMREAVMQIGNICIPITTVAGFDKICKKHGKGAQALGAICGIFAGVYVANFLMNKLSNLMFNEKNDRGVKLVDFSAHVDDLVVGASYVSSSKLIHGIARMIPAILILPGVEVGCKKAN